MRPDWSFDTRRLARRDILRRGLAVGAGTATAITTRGSAVAQSLPGATPGTIGDARGALLIDPAWLRERAGDAALRVVALTPAEEFAEGHIAGAAQIDWPAFEVIDTSDASIARWRGEVERTLSKLGIYRDATVVSYDGGTLFAARLWWILHYLGHAGAGNRVLDGGLAAWQATGGEVTDDPASGEAAALTPTAPYQSAPQPEVLAQLAEVRAGLDDPGVVFVDARTPEEYAAGHIPGAVNLNYPLNAQPEPPRTWKPVAELRAMYQQLGVTPDKTVIPYCTSGVRSAVTFFTLRLLDYPRVALYTGSWQEWERVPGLPVES